MPKSGQHPVHPVHPCRHRCVVAVAVQMIACSLPLSAVQPPESVNPNDEAPGRREILQLIRKLEGGGDQPVQAAETFDVAWEMAVRREDPILNTSTGDARPLQPGQHEINAGARARLQSIFENGSVAFGKAYEEFASVRAKERLAEALATGSVRDLTQHILRYQFTKVGQQALENIIQLRLSRGEYLAASLQYGRLLRLRKEFRPESRTRLAMLWWRAGLREEAVDYLRKVSSSSAGSKLEFNGKQITLPAVDSDLVDWMTREFGGTAIQQSWSQSAGNYRRIGVQPVGPAQLQKAWSVSGLECVECVDCENDDEINLLLQPLAAQLEDEFRLGLASNMTMAPVALPVVVSDRLIFRGAAKLRCVDCRTGELQWETTLIDRFLNSALESWRRQGMDDERALKTIQDGLRSALSQHWNLANGGGQLTANSELVFAVEESTSETTIHSSSGRGETAVNYLRAYDIETGRLKGQAGGAIGASGRSGRANPLAGMYFLGAPLILDNQIYAMAESDQGIFLLQIRTVPLFDEEGQVDIRPVSSQLLSTPRLSLRDHPVRKFAGVTPSFSNGLLVCNTCDEQVIAVSAEDRSVRWIYRYPGNVSMSEIGREHVLGSAFSRNQSTLGDQNNRWIDALPKIHSERIYLTPRDCDRLICLDLDSGKQIWSQPRGPMRQLAVVNKERLVLTGNHHVECRAAETGEQIWKYEFETEKVCGRAINNGVVIQVPTSADSVVTLDIKTGRRLLSQPVSGGLPGNLVSIDNRLFSQTVSGVNAYELPESLESPELASASRLLLQGELAEAEVQIQAVRAKLNKTSTVRRVADNMLIEHLLESLRVDFEANVDRIPELEQLILAGAVSDEELADLMFTMVGMSVGDAAALPKQWRRLNRNRDRLTQLKAMVTRKFLATGNGSTQEIARQLIALLENMDDKGHIKVGDTLISSRRNTLATVGNALKTQSPASRRKIETQIGRYLQQKIHDAVSETEAMSFWQSLLTCGLTSYAAELAIENDVSLPPKFATAVMDLSLLQAIDDGHTDGSVLLSRWSNDNPLLFQDIVARSQRRIRNLKNSPFGDAAVQPTTVRDFLLPPRIKLDNPDWHSAASTQTGAGPYQGTPGVTETPARIGQSPAPLFMDSPIQRIPIRGSAGAFSNWDLLQQPGSSVVHAYDAQGRHRWSYRPKNPKTLMPRVNPTPNYAIAFGQFLGLSINDMLLMLDCSEVNSKDSPTLLWSINVSAEVGAPSGAQAYQPAFLRTEQYDPLSAGSIPLGEFSSLGVPVYSGRRLAMIDLLSGGTEWVVDGIPDDCSMTSVGDEVLLMSSGSGTVECRSCLDGSVMSVTPLPEWWNDAKENSNASIHQLELNPGEAERWMLSVSNGHSLLLKRSTEASSLDLYDLKAGTTEWSVDLPQDTVVSNVVDGNIAVLSNGNSLQIFDIAGGTSVCRHKVPDAVKSMHLYLRRSGGKWLVLTNAFDPNLDDDTPPLETVGVNGHVYGVESQTGELSWTKEVKGEYIRVRSPRQAVMPSSVPVLLLMKRPWGPPQPSQNGRRSAPVYQAKILDVRSGEMLYHSENLGRQLSYHCMNLNPTDKAVTIGFGIRDVIFEYGKAKEPDASR